MPEVIVRKGEPVDRALKRLKNKLDAEGILDEVIEARRVVERVTDLLRQADVDVMPFHDNTSTTQDENLKAIVSYHNSQDRDYDISVHFNCYQKTAHPMGTEVWYVTQQELAAKLSEAIADAGGFLNRGGKYTNDLYFLNNTEMPAVLLEVCFVDSTADAAFYDQNFDAICRAIAEVMVDIDNAEVGSKPLFEATGMCSSFGGPDDDGVAPDEELAFINDVSEAPYLFLPIQPPGTTGLARRLDPAVNYIACRWDYDRTPKDMLKSGLVARVTSPSTGRSFPAWPADWGPHEDTGRVADLSPGLMDALGIETDDVVQVEFPCPSSPAPPSS